MKEKLVKILLENVNVSGIAFALIDDVLEEALQKVVDDSTNTVDDMLMAAIYPILEKELKELLQKKIDEVLEKI